jgi:ATP-dependent helicase/DNAse subunit B
MTGGMSPVEVPRKNWFALDEVLRTARPPVLELPDTLPAEDGEVAGLGDEQSLKEQIKDYVFSPSSLETALNCPLQFYYQRLLRIYPDDKLERKDGYWLEKNAIGTFCHRVLERYYAEKATDVAPIFAEEQELLEQEYPTVRRSDMDAAIEKMRTMVERAIAWTKAMGITVLSTEAEFGKANDKIASKGLKLKIGSREVLLTGSIDRVDQWPDGTCRILDYKTGNAYFFRRDIDKHLQHYLYTLAEEELYKDQDRKVTAASYLFLEEADSCEEIVQDQAKRDEMKKKMENLLAMLEKEETAQLPAPCFEYDQKDKFVPGKLEQRREAQEACRKYCKYAALCPDVE